MHVSLDQCTCYSVHGVVVVDQLLEGGGEVMEVEEEEEEEEEANLMVTDEIGCFGSHSSPHVK